VIPLRDDNPTRRRAIVTILLIVANVGIYFLVQPSVDDPDAASFTYRRAAIPCELVTGDPLTLEEINSGYVGEERCERDDAGPAQFPDKSPFLAVLTSMFLHGGLLHLGGNMLFLWVFGNNIEDRLGRIRYLVFYLAAGIVATLAHVALQPSSTIPVVGASGAIAGIMGAYLIWHPNVRIRTIFMFFFIFPFKIRAKWLLGFWFLSQFFVNPNEGVAWGAHVGGFLFGALVGLLLRPRRQPAGYVGVPGW
jgi:membrane associated rhomboid family serine protease